MKTAQSIYWQGECCMCGFRSKIAWDELL